MAYVDMYIPPKASVRAWPLAYWHILREASALFARSTNRAMRRPQRVERATSTALTLFCIIRTNTPTGACAVYTYFYMLREKIICQIKTATTFSELKSIFDKLIESGQASVNSDLFVIGYSSLLSDLEKSLTIDFGIKELEAACYCYQLMMKYAANNISQMVQSIDGKIILNANQHIIPPLKNILRHCDRFNKLSHLIQVQISSNHLNTSEINGDDYAKQWNIIFTNGYKGAFDKIAINHDKSYLYESAELIRQMNLNDENKELLQPWKITSILYNYYEKTRNTRNNGTIRSKAYNVFLRIGDGGLRTKDFCILLTFLFLIGFVFVYTIHTEKSHSMNYTKHEPINSIDHTKNFSLQDNETQTYSTKVNDSENRITYIDSIAIGDIKFCISEIKFNRLKKTFLNAHPTLGGLKIYSFKGFFYNGQLAAIELISVKQSIFANNSYYRDDNGWKNLVSKKYNGLYHSNTESYETNSKSIFVTDICATSSSANNYSELLNRKYETLHRCSYSPNILFKDNIEAMMYTGYAFELTTSSRSEKLKEEMEMEIAEARGNSITPTAPIYQRYYSLIRDEANHNAKSHNDKIKNAPSYSVIRIIFKPLKDVYDYDIEIKNSLQKLEYYEDSELI